MASPISCEGVAQGPAQPADVVRAEVGDEPGTGPADLLDGQHDPWLGVVVVVADRHRPRDRRGVVGARRQVVRGERLVVDRAAHARQPATPAGQRQRCGEAEVEGPLDGGSDATTGTDQLGDERLAGAAGLGEGVDRGAQGDPWLGGPRAVEALDAHRPTVADEVDRAARADVEADPLRRPVGPLGTPPRQEQGERGAAGVERRGRLARRGRWRRSGRRRAAPGRCGGPRRSGGTRCAPPAGAARPWSPARRPAGRAGARSAGSGRCRPARCADR